MVRIGGVPEHFNMPWHWAIDTGMFDNSSIKIEWKDYAGGTGEMNKALKNNEIDLAVLLTEGAIVEIAKGNPYKILQWYVKSPLIWGVHVAANSPLNHLNEISNHKYAISRIGSGSHLMAHVEADTRNMQISDNQFVMVNNLAGAATALTNNEAQIFLWEKFMTKPLVDKGIFKKIGECPTPWSSFVLVGNIDFVANSRQEVKKIGEIIQSAATNFKNLPNVANLISEKYNLALDDANEWLREVEWANHHNAHVNAGDLEVVCAKLQKLGLLDINPDRNYIFE